MLPKIIQKLASSLRAFLRWSLPLPFPNKSSKLTIKLLWAVVVGHSPSSFPFCMVVDSIEVVPFKSWPIRVDAWIFKMKFDWKKIGGWGDSKLRNSQNGMISLYWRNVLPFCLWIFFFLHIKIWRELFIENV